MHIYIVYAHPSHECFTCNVLESFLEGLRTTKHTWEIGDLYRMGFKAEMDLEQYNRETGPDPDAPVPGDVQAEHAKLDAADALVLIYPVWWSDCPAILKGWFDRVFTYGYAYYYENDEHKISRVSLRKALILAPAGHTNQHLEETGIADSMRKIMLNDRLLGVGVQEAEMVLLGGMTMDEEAMRKINLRIAYEAGQSF